MPRPRKNTVQVNARVDGNVIDALTAINPSLVTRDSVSGKIKFRHGAFGKYLERLIRADIEERKKRRTDNQLDNFMKGKEFEDESED